MFNPPVQAFCLPLLAGGCTCVTKKKPSTNFSKREIGGGSHAHTHINRSVNNIQFYWELLNIWKLCSRYIITKDQTLGVVLVGLHSVGTNHRDLQNSCRVTATHKTQKSTGWFCCKHANTAVKYVCTSMSAYPQIGLKTIAKWNIKSVDAVVFQCPAYWTSVCSSINIASYFK